MKPDEEQFLRTMLLERPRPTMDGPDAVEVGMRLGIHHKRALRLIEKWSRNGWWDYGTSPHGGWLTKLGVKKAQELLAIIA